MRALDVWDARQRARNFLVRAVAIVGDASAVQVGLIALLTAFFALRWIQTSYAWDKLRRSR